MQSFYVIFHKHIVTCDTCKYHWDLHAMERPGEIGELVHTHIMTEHVDPDTFTVNIIRVDEEFRMLGSTQSGIIGR